MASTHTSYFHSIARSPKGHIAVEVQVPALSFSIVDIGLRHYYYVYIRFGDTYSNRSAYPPDARNLKTPSPHIPQ